MSTSDEDHDQDDVEALREALFGRSVVGVKEGSDRKIGYGYTAEGEVYLDDGTVLVLAGNVGACSCGGGDYALTALNDMPVNGITDVQVEVKDGTNDPTLDGYGQTYSIFVLAKDERIRLADFEGDDGSGYYGTGFWFKVVKP